MIDRKLLLGLSLVLLSTCYDLTRSYFNSASAETKNSESVSSSSFNSDSNDNLHMPTTPPYRPNYYLHQQQQGEHLLYVLKTAAISRRAASAHISNSSNTLGFF
ncbi:unnamed protein product [Rotaria socialis]|uniref:Uncharacterized protein n=1 Tax=Rotaria socialis TaxID=392032 RepID=A0A820YMM6_9BILA|nr:unnamed protein product [Rotaria socialis]